jgi:hypothetical protein
MTARSSASFISYDLRPAKQAERRMIMDYLTSLKESGIAVSGHRYIGLGGIRFYDFALVHRFLGISDLVSCERSKKMWSRSLFNRPFSNIKIQREAVGSYIRTNLELKPAVCWLDYDNALNSAIIDDIQMIGRKSQLGSAAFVTVACEMPRDMSDLTELQRLEQIKEEFGEFASDCDEDDMEEANFSNAYFKILKSVFLNSFSGREDGNFIRNFNVIYKDSINMLTVGGCFISDEYAKKFRISIRQKMKFLTNEESPYKIRNYTMTEKERHLFEFSASARKNCPEANMLRELGFSDDDLKSYRELVRFMPRYVEAMT